MDYNFKWEKEIDNLKDRVFGRKQKTKWYFKD